MTAIVLDCSIAVSWFFEDEASDKTDRILHQVKANGAWVPNLFHLEITNVMLQAKRRDRINFSEIKKCLNILSELPIRTDTETHIRAVTDILFLARDERLTTYDAAYLELAIRRDLSLASKDKSMIKSARKMKIHVVN